MIYIYEFENKCFNTFCHPDCEECFAPYSVNSTNCISCSDKDKFLYMGNCYKKCPSGVPFLNKKINKKICKEELKCPKEKPYEYISKEICIEFCSIYELENNICNINYKNRENSEQEKIELKKKIIQNIQKEITTYFNTNEIDKGKSIIIPMENDNLIITSINNQINLEKKNSSLSSLVLGKCEEKIKNEYNIDKDKSLYIMKLELYQEGYDIPKIQYELYYPLFNDSSLVRLNLDICKGLNNNISIPVPFIEDISKIDPNGDYYNDICYRYTIDNNKDIPLSQRRKEFIMKKLSKCEDDCKFLEYNNSLGKVKCSCPIKTSNLSYESNDIKIDTNKLLKNFIDIKNLINIEFLKCYDLLLAHEAFSENYAFIIFFVMFFLLFFSLIIFMYKDYKEIIKLKDMIIYFKINSVKIKEIVNIKKKEYEEQFSKFFKYDKTESNKDNKDDNKDNTKNPNY